VPRIVLACAALAELPAACGGAPAEPRPGLAPPSLAPPAGVGLFETMDLGDHGRWQPNRRTRRIEAFVYDPARARLARAPGLDARCPRRGYIPFVATPVLDDPLAWRLELQGEPPPARCPDPAKVNGCFNVCD
jgi:hypothetical protein